MPSTGALGEPRQENPREFENIRSQAQLIVVGFDVALINGEQLTASGPVSMPKYRWVQHSVKTMSWVEGQHLSI